jgi:hypothetical protein
VDVCAAGSGPRRVADVGARDAERVHLKDLLSVGSVTIWK